MQRAGAIQPAPQGMPNVGTTVHRITNIKPLQQETATMITNHITRQVFIRPTTSRAVYRPGDTISIELNAFDTDYINLQDSAFMMKLHVTAIAPYTTETYIGHVAQGGPATAYPTTFNPSIMMRKILANGSASLIKRVRVTSGTNLVMDIEKYDIFMGTMTEMQAPSGFQDHETLINCTGTSTPYSSTLFMPATGTAEVASQANTKNDVWIRVPLFTIFNESGFFPNYQMSNKVVITITLNDNNAVWKPSVVAPSHVCGVLDSATANPLRNVVSHQRIIPGPVYPDNDTGGYVGYTFSDPQFSYYLTDVLLVAHGLTVTSGGQLDADPVTIYTDSYQMMSTPTTGAMVERHTFQFKKSSISAAWGVFTDPIGVREQDWRYPTPDMWLRAGAIGGINEHGTIYDPSIQWWSMELGGRRFPTDDGCGMMSPPDRDTNCIHMWHEFERFLSRNDITGYTFPPSITPYCENDHGVMKFSSVHPVVPIHSTERVYSTSNTVSQFDLQNLASMADNPLAMSPAYYGYSMCMFGGLAARRGVKKQATNIFATMDFDNFSTNGLPGSKFIIACTFTPIDHAGSLIQGVDTERYDFTINWQRAMPIVDGKVIPAGYPYFTDAPAGAEYDGYFLPMGTLTERIPDFSIFFRYNIKITIQNGVITVMD